MAIIEVTLSEMASAAGKIQRASGEFLSTANKVLTDAETLSGCWEGDSQVAFMDEQRKANEWYRQMTDLVNNYVSSLRDAEKTYDTTDADAANAINKC